MERRPKPKASPSADRNPRFQTVPLSWWILLALLGVNWLLLSV